MRYTLETNLSMINFFPQTEAEEIIQNVTTIITTRVGSVPLFRVFGTEHSYLDDPIPMSKAKQIAEIIEKVEYFEPRVTVEEVKFVGDGLEGQLYPTVVFSIKSGVDT